MTPLSLSEPEGAIVAAGKIVDGSSNSLGSESMDQPEDLNDEDAAFAWLESLAARQGANPEELTSKPADRDLEPPDWIKNAIENESINQSEQSVEPEEQIEPTSSEELPVFNDSDETTESVSDAERKPGDLATETPEDVVIEPY